MRFFSASFTPKHTQTKARSCKTLLSDRIQRRNSHATSLKNNHNPLYLSISTLSESLCTTGNEIIPQHHVSIIKISFNEAFFRFVTWWKWANMSDILGKESSKGKRSSHSPNYCSDAKCSPPFNGWGRDSSGKGPRANISITEKLLQYKHNVGDYNNA